MTAFIRNVLAALALPIPLHHPQVADAHAANALVLRAAGAAWASTLQRLAAAKQRSK